MKVTTAANDVYGAWREGTHDDLVLAASLALWAGKGIPDKTVHVFRAGGR